MTKTEPVTGVCRECGISANVLTCLKKFGQRPMQLAFSVSTFHTSTCDVCGSKDVPVTEPRDFFHPDFSLLADAREQFERKNK